MFVSAVESYLAQGKDGELGVTGEGSLLDHAQGKNYHIYLKYLDSLTPHHTCPMIVKVCSTTY